jgi:hypothetical protein
MRCAKVTAIKAWLTTQPAGGVTLVFTPKHALGSISTRASSPRWRACAASHSRRLQTGTQGSNLGRNRRSQPIPSSTLGPANSTKRRDTSRSWKRARVGLSRSLYAARRGMLPAGAASARRGFVSAMGAAAIVAVGINRLAAQIFSQHFLAKNKSQCYTFLFAGQIPRRPEPSRSERETRMRSNCDCGALETGRIFI